MNNKAAIVAGLFLWGCAAFDPTAEQMLALNGCTARWRIEFPEFYGDKDEATQRRSLAVMEPDEISFDADGYFEFSQPPSDSLGRYDMQFVCGGNINRRTIEWVRLDQQLRRPTPNSSWSF